MYVHIVTSFFIFWAEKNSERYALLLWWTYVFLGLDQPVKIATSLRFFSRKYLRSLLNICIIAPGLHVSVESCVLVWVFSRLYVYADASPYRWCCICFQRFNMIFHTISYAISENLIMPTLASVFLPASQVSQSWIMASCLQAQNTHSLLIPCERQLFRPSQSYKKAI